MNIEYDMCARIYMITLCVYASFRYVVRFLYSLSGAINHRNYVYRAITHIALRVRRRTPDRGLRTMMMLALDASFQCTPARP